MLLMMHWGTPTQVGSLCNIRELICLDKAEKVFNVCDEFLLHAYRSHLQSVQSLTLTALKQILSMTQPCTGWRPWPTQWCRTHYTLPPHAPILSTTYTGHFCIHDFSTPTYGRLLALKMAITSSDTGSCGYHGSWEQVARITVPRQPTNLTAQFPRHISYIATHNRTVTSHPQS